jgi:DNA replication protein DnaC
METKVKRLYTREEVKDLPDDKLYELLADAWNLNNSKFLVFGEIKRAGEIKRVEENLFSFFTECFSIANQQELVYPLQDLANGSNAFYVNPKDTAACLKKSTRQWIECELELSPLAERNKKDNPFLMCVKWGTAQRLTTLPSNIPVELIDQPMTDKKMVKESIYEFYRSEVIVKVEQQQVQLEQKQATIQSKIERLTDEKQTLEQDHNQLIQDITEQTAVYADLIQKSKQTEAQMQQKIQRLKKYVQDKADFLKTFELVDQDVLDAFIQDPLSTPIENDGSYVSFEHDLDRDYSKAVSHIQAHLMEDDILYPRHIIENYLTLLRTKDLIVLAGDSGSGKTSLVTSFAKAVGGRAIVIPVKPNWTSSEDLLGYYNPLEKKYMATPFLQAMQEAIDHPNVPYFICLDEMNLARVEYYFADFLSLLETRNTSPDITLYAEDESAHVLSELKAVVEVIESTKEKYQRDGIVNFVELLQDETLNTALRLAFGFSDKDSLVKYHGEVRRMLSTVMDKPATLKFPANLHIIGTINIDETTHYLSPKILDRAHIMRFQSPLLLDWEVIKAEVEANAVIDANKPLLMPVECLGERQPYPKFETNNDFCKWFVELNRDCFDPLGLECGLRTLRQGRHYLKLFAELNDDSKQGINNFLMHKILPKLTFDGTKVLKEGNKLDFMKEKLKGRFQEAMSDWQPDNTQFSATDSLQIVINHAEANDGVVNFWAKS